MINLVMRQFERLLDWLLKDSSHEGTPELIPIQDNYHERQEPRVFDAFGEPA